VDTLSQEIRFRVAIAPISLAMASAVMSSAIAALAYTRQHDIQSRDIPRLTEINLSLPPQAVKVLAGFASPGAFERPCIQNPFDH